MSDPLFSPADSPPKAKIRWGQIVVWVLVIGLLGMLGVKLFQVRAGPVSQGRAPEFTLMTFDGQAFSLSALRGRVVVVNFWASWCPPCELEAPDLERFWRTYQEQGVLLLGVDYADTEAEALASLERWGVTYPNGPDLGTRISQAFRTTGLPETYVIDKDGHLTEAIIGATSYAQLARIIERLLVE